MRDCLFSPGHAFIFNSLISEVVVVSVNTSTELGCLHETLSTDFVIAIEGNIKLEEASVSLWESRLTHVCIQTNLMLS